MSACFSPLRIYLFSENYKILFWIIIKSKHLGKTTITLDQIRYAKPQKKLMWLPWLNPVLNFIFIGPSVLHQMKQNTGQYSNKVENWLEMGL